MIRCLLFLLLTASLAGAQTAPYRCVVRLNGADCTNCIAGASRMAELAPGLPMSFVVQRSFRRDSAQVFRFFQARLPQLPPITWSDSLFAALSPDPWSTVHIEDTAGQIVFQCPLKSFNRYLPALNAFAYPDFQPEGKVAFQNLHIASDSRLMVTDSLFAWVDHPQNQVFVGHWRGHPTRKLALHAIEPGEVVRRSRDRADGYDLTEQRREILARLHRPPLQVEAGLARLDTLFILASVPYLTLPDPEQPNHITVDFSLVIAAFHFDQLLWYRPVEAKLPRKYDLDQTNAFWVAGEDCWLSVFRDLPARHHPQWGRYRNRSGQAMAYTGALDWQLPEYFRQHGLGYDFNHARIEGDWLLFERAPELWNLRTGKLLHLPWLDQAPVAGPTGQPRFRQRVHSIHQTGDLVQVLAELDGGLLVGTYDLAKETWLGNARFEHLALPPHLGNVQWLKGGRLALLSPENELVVVRMQAPKKSLSQAEVAESAPFR